MASSAPSAARAHSTFLVEGRRYWQCAQCRAQTTLRSGTLLHAARVPLTTWFQAIYLVTQNRNNISALSLAMRRFGSRNACWAS